nr:hypothetical protein [Tanacetum cinerariifolium]
QTSLAGASLSLSSGNLSSLALGKYSGSRNFFTGSGNALSILFPTPQTLVVLVSWPKTRRSKRGPKVLIFLLKSCEKHLIINDGNEKVGALNASIILS